MKKIQLIFLFPCGGLSMKRYIALYIIMIIIGIIIFASSIYNRKEIAPWLLISLCLIGIFVVIMSIAMILCIGLFII